MKKHIPYRSTFVLLAGLCALAFPARAERKVAPATGSVDFDLTKDTITQVSSYSGLLAALYDGVVSYDALKPFGDFGLGTFDKLDGEMVMLDGVLYQIDFSGTVREMPGDVETPYATLTHFEPDQEIELPAGMSYDEVSELLESKLVNANLPYAVRIDGIFEMMKCRSVPAQEKPYAALSEITVDQAIFEKNNVRGTLVGFRYPKYAGAFNPPGFHLHFVSDDRTFGGHALAFTTGTGVVAKLDRSTKLLVYIPDTEAGREADLSLDRSAAVDRVNRDK